MSAPRPRRRASTLWWFDPLLGSLDASKELRNLVGMDESFFSRVELVRWLGLLLLESIDLSEVLLIRIFRHALSWDMCLAILALDLVNVSVPLVVLQAKLLLVVVRHFIIIRSLEIAHLM